MTPEEIQQLFAYNTWGLDRVWECVERLTEDQFVKEVDYSRGSVRNQMLHITTAIERWMQRLEGATPSPMPEEEGFPTCASVRERWDQTNSALTAYVKTLDQSRLDERIPGRLASRGLDFNLKRSDLLLHLANHCTDHRAQVLAILHSEFGVPTVEQDLVLYLIEAAGAPE